MSTSAPPPASLSTQRTLRPWYLIITMISSWLIGVLGLSESFTNVLFLRENSVPDVQALVHGLTSENEPAIALKILYESAYLRALGEAAKIAFPLAVGKLILSVLLVITSAMAMSGRPGSRTISIQAHLAYATLAAATYWLLRDVRYAAIDVMVSVNHLLPKLNSLAPSQGLETLSMLFGKSFLVWTSRIGFTILGGALLAGAAALMTNRTKAFFEATAAATPEDTEDL